MKKWIGVVVCATLLGTLFGYIPNANYAKADDQMSQVSSKDKGQAKISKKDAEDIALKEVKDKGEVVRTELESDDGMLQYDVTVKTSDAVYEVEIDAKTGKVLEVEKEGHHGDDDQYENEGYDD